MASLREWLEDKRAEGPGRLPALLLVAAGLVGVGSSGDLSMLARCSLVNLHGVVLYDTFGEKKRREKESGPRKLLPLSLTTYFPSPPSFLRTSCPQGARDRLPHAVQWCPPFQHQAW